MRYLPQTEADRHQMLATIGVETIDDLFRTIPQTALLTKPLDGLPLAQSEAAVERHFTRASNKNLVGWDVPMFAGAGAYRHHVPASVDHLIQRSEFLTSYTPYQPEIAQGTTQSLFEFQTQVARLTGMGIANASMYDGSTACAEAVLMAARVTRRSRAVLAGGLHPHYAATTEMLARQLNIDVIQSPPQPTRSGDDLSSLDESVACVVVQTPNVFGELIDLEPIAEAAHKVGALLVAVVTEIVSLGAVKSPGEMGADIVAAEGQSIGNAMNFGGPYVGLFATRNDRNLIRQMPGRLCGETVDADGKRGFVLTLSTREQHIRRDKATSNICTNSGLCCLAWTIHMSLLGQKGMARLATLNHEAALSTAEALGTVKGVTVLNETFFNEFTVALPRAADSVVEALAHRGVIAGVPLSRLYPGAGFDNHLLIAATELTDETQISQLVTGLREVL
jgi:glycine dehydrogenase subunit 1